MGWGGHMGSTSLCVYTCCHDVHLLGGACALVGLRLMVVVMVCTSCVTLVCTIFP